MAMSVATSLEYLVDLFMNDDPELEDDVKPQAGFQAEGCVDDAHDADDTSAGFEQMDADFLRKHFGRTLKHMGDEEMKRYEQKTHKPLLSTQIQTFFSSTVQEAGGDPEVFWPRFRDMMDDAIKDTGLTDVSKQFAAVLVSVTGLMYLGSGLKGLILRYIQERNLDEDLHKLSEHIKESGGHPSLD